MSKARDMSSDRETQPRVSSSGVVISQEEAVSSSRSVVLPDVPARWLDRLLVAQCELPVAQGEGAVARAILEAVQGCVPNVALGAIISSPHAREVIRLGEQKDAPAADRLFPSLAHERSVRVPDGSDSCIVVASNEPAIEDDTAPTLQLLQRAAFLLRTGLELAREHVRTDKLRRDARARESLLIQAEKLATLGQLAAGMVHELNNPLTSIVAYTDFLTKRASARQPVDEPEIEKLRRISESAHRMLRFTRDLVQYARPIDVRGPVVMSNVIDTAITFCEHLLDETGVEIERRFGDGVLPVRGASEQLVQVFVNLITNACHAMTPDGGKLVIGTEVASDETYIRASVEDSGHGMDGRTLSQVFEPFFTTKSEGRGSGLGLSIVKSIVDQHEGTIEVESVPSQGARFIITLPVAASDRPSRT